MAEKRTQTQTHARLLNPWVLHLQKLGLELKCPLCLNLYNKPMLLPCNHIFCSRCVPESNSFGSECSICKQPYVEQDLRGAPYIGNLVNIYTSLDASFSMHMLNPDVRRGLVQCPIPAQRCSKDPIDSTSLGNLACGTTSVPLRVNEQVVVPNSTPVMTMLERCTSFGNTGLGPGVLEHNSPTSVTSFSQGRALQQKQHVAVDVDMNRVELSPDSPPSSGASKGAEIDSCDQERNNDTAGKCQSKKSLKREVDDLGTPGTGDLSDSYCKKQKQTNLSQVELSQSPSPSTGLNQQTSVSTGSATAKTECAPNFKCAFCQTGKITQGSGQLHHFANGKQVFGKEAGRSNVTHLHQSCIEWTPQIYYENDTTIRNVDKELARAEKLKCTSCGLKGAALGCFAKSCRRTYHAPCAYEIPECRWDDEDFLMLCPVHSSIKFPSEKSKKSAAKKASTVKIHDELKNKDLSSSTLPAVEFSSWMLSSTQNWVLCASSLSADEKTMLVKFANLCGATVTRNWTPEVTHVIAGTDANGACSRTLKVLMAILKGRWILKTDWIRACMELKRPVEEEPYEINLDNHGCCDGPRTGRLRALNNVQNLLNGMKFYFSGDFLAKYQWDLQDLIIAGGGAILENKEQLLHCSSNGLGTTVVVYNADAVTGTGDVSTVLERQLEAEMVAAESDCHVVPHTWLLGSIASNKLHPFV
ncbi:BRCA1-associated RING domain protein 1 [Silene latifolia]|uniref:BRCA1-associated RING domain protein 1 n=1 Tax=Silene latifolia TaxID=37657 RepID=UPI003D788E45